ncbi:MAG: hypothetical protein AB7K52_08040 [Phycisphaerales bacterium]
MTTLVRARAVVARARRRRLAAMMLEHVGQWALVGAAGAGVAVIAAKGVGLNAGWIPALVALPLAGVVYGLARALAHRPTNLDAARELDTALDLRGRLANAADWNARAPQRQDEAFVALALADAERAAGSVRPEQVVGVRAGWRWGAWPAAIAAAALLGVYLPAGPWWRSGAARETIARASAERRAAVDRIEQLRQELAPALRETAPTGGAEATAADLRSLDEIQKSVERGEADPARAAAEVASTLERAADEAEERAVRQRDEARALRDRVARATREAATARANAGAGGAERAEADELTQTMADGDFAGAADAVERALEQMKAMPAADRQRLAEELEALARGLEQTEPGARRAEAKEPRAADPGVPAAADGQPGGASEASAADETPTDEAARAAKEALREGGVPEARAEEAARGADERALNEELRQAGVEESRAAELSRQVREERKRNETKRDAERRAEELKKALEQAAEELRETPGENTGKKPGETPRPGESKREPGGTSQTSGEQREPSDGGEQGERGAQKPSSTRPTGAPARTAPSDSPRAPASGAKPEPAPTGNEAKGTPGEAKETKESTEGPREASAGERREAKPGEQAKPREEPKPGEQVKPGEQKTQRGAPDAAGARPDQSPPGGQTQPSPPSERPQPGQTPQSTPRTQPSKPGQAPPSGQPSQPDRPGQPGERPESRPGVEQQRQPGEGPRPGVQPEGAPAPDGAPSAGERSGREPVKSPTPGEAPGAGEKPGGERAPTPGAEGAPGARPDPTGMPEERPGRMPELPGDERGMERLAKQLREIAEQQRGAKRDEAQAERMRKMAREWWDGASAEQRERAAKLARELAREGRPTGDEGGTMGESTEREPGSPMGGAPVDRERRAEGSGGAGAGSEAGRGATARDGERVEPGAKRATETVDARAGDRPGGAPDRVIAEWLSGARGTGRAGEGPAPEAVRAELREAARAAQRAVDDRLVPRRFDRLIREFFRRAPEELGVSPAGAPGPSAPSGGPASK